MQVKPVKKRRVPDYPTRQEVLATPGLLERYLPESWLRKRWVAGSLSVMLVAAGCKSNGSSKVVDTTAKPHKSAAEHIETILGFDNMVPLRGGAMYFPTTTPSEEEAMQAISDEMGASQPSGDEAGDSPPLNHGTEIDLPAQLQDFADWLQGQGMV